MKKTIIDIETTGLVPKGVKWQTNFNQFPFIVEIAILIEENGKITKNLGYVIKPDNYTIPIVATQIHGISQETAIKEGVSFKDAFNHIYELCKGSDKIIGHNIYFDTSIIKANIIRYGLNISDWDNLLDKNKRFDTMMKTIKFCNIRQKNGRGLKFPTLVELHTKLFGKGFEAHSAVNDTLATYRCYNELLRRGIM